MKETLTIQMNVRYSFLAIVLMLIRQLGHSMLTELVATILVFITVGLMIMGSIVMELMNTQGRNSNRQQTELLGLIMGFTDQSHS